MCGCKCTVSTKLMVIYFTLCSALQVNTSSCLWNLDLWTPFGISVFCRLIKYKHAGGTMTLEKTFEIFRDPCPFHIALPFLLADPECESSFSVPATVPDSCLASDIKETYSSDTVSKIKPLFCTFSWLWCFITAKESNNYSF